MAKINELNLVVKISELLRDDDEFTPIMDAETLSQLVAVIQELSGNKALVEVVELKSEE